MILHSMSIYVRTLCPVVWLGVRCAVVTYQTERSASAAVNATNTEDAVRLNERLDAVIFLCHLILPNLI